MYDCSHYKASFSVRLGLSLGRIDTTFAVFAVALSAAFSLIFH